MGLKLKMETIESCIESIGNNMCLNNVDVEANDFYNNFSHSLLRYWEKIHDKLNDHPKRTGALRNACGTGFFAFIKSCKYTEFLNKKTLELFENQNKELKLSISSLVQESFLKSENTILENQELKSLIYGMLEEISELKDHNRSLSERINCLENKQVEG